MKSLSKGVTKKLRWEESAYLLGRFTEKKIGHPIISNIAEFEGCNSDKILQAGKHIAKS